MTDWKKILAAYIAHVAMMEGIDFLYDGIKIDGLSDLENAALAELASSIPGVSNDQKNALLQYAMQLRAENNK